MKKINTILLGLSTASLMFLAACNNSSPTSSTPTPIPKPEPTTEANPESTTEIATEDHSQPAAGGQVIEAGKYHLEFVPEAEADKFHLDFYLQSGDTHEPVTDAQVTGQIQLPSGEQKSVDFTYDAEGGHYTGVLPTAESGAYQAVIQTNINGEKVNGRFAFNK
ncbi:hypothetical protein [Pleurocapsa sp. FMAR1]|uniref:hypothetical protein n=1 Tax=Pleurocapsa sp. FMAR1 TaxID=3040204 RepID=UPI0029C753C6|nr:hypothetical protein [Pleurocapsa sp. FMAR1]